MEFFATIKQPLNECDLQTHLSINSLPQFCKSVSQVLEHHSETGRIYCLWGEFKINREHICGGIRFSLSTCPNSLAWTITTGLPPIEDQTQIYLSVSRHQLDEDFIESIHAFMDDLQQGIKDYFENKESNSMSEVKTLMDFVKAAKSNIQEVPVSSLRGLIKDGYNILDVREHDEYLQGTLPDALNIPRGMIEAVCDANYPAKREEMMDRNKPWLVLCATSGRSAMVTDVMQQMGFTNVKNINGGMGAVREAKIDIVIPPLHNI